MKQMLMGVGTGVVVGIGIPFLFRAIRVPELDLSWADLAVTVAGLVVMLFAAIGVHEAGHVAAGALAGFRPHMLVIGPLKFERRATGWSAGVNRTSPKFGGLAGGIPVKTDRLRQRLLTMIAGGPGTSLLAAGVAFALLASRPVDAPATLAGWPAIGYVLALGFAVVSLFLGVIALLPTEHAGYASDGTRILRFLTANDQVDAEVVVLTIASASMAGQRPRDWDAALIAQGLLAAPDTVVGVAAQYLAHLHAVDRGDLEEARPRLAQALAHVEKVPQTVRHAILMTAARFAAVWEGDAATARQHQGNAGEGALMNPHAAPLTEAAIRVAEGRADARESLDEAERQLGEATDRGSAAADVDFIALLRARLASEHRG